MRMRTNDEMQRWISSEIYTHGGTEMGGGELQVSTDKGTTTDRISDQGNILVEVEGCFSACPGMKDAKRPKL